MAFLQAVIIAFCIYACKANMDINVHTCKFNMDELILNCDIRSEVAAPDRLLKGVKELIIRQHGLETTLVDLKNLMPDLTKIMIEGSCEKVMIRNKARTTKTECLRKIKVTRIDFNFSQCFSLVHKTGGPLPIEA